MAVTKGRSLETIRELRQLGVSDFGENRHQEALSKAEALLSGPPLRWHFIGQLQSNKARAALRYMSVLHSLDRLRLLQVLNDATNPLSPQGSQPLRTSALPLPVLIQINLDRFAENREGGRESSREDSAASRGGIAPEELESFADRVLQAPGLQLRGISAVANPRFAAEPQFEYLAQLSCRLRALAPEAQWISGGMSEDFEAAIRQGATHIRLGRVIVS